MSPDDRSQSLWTRPFVLAVFTAFLGAQIPNVFVIAPRFLAAHGLDEQEIGIVMGGFNVASLAAMLIWGRLLERLGPKGPLIVSCLLAACGCVLFEFAGGPTSWAAARALQGFGFAGVLVGVSAFVAESAPPGRLAQALGVAGVLILVAQALGPSMAEVLERAFGWPWVFRTAAIGAVVGALTALFLPGAVHGRDEAPRSPVGAGRVLAVTFVTGVGFGTIWVFLADYVSRVGLGWVAPFFLCYVATAISTRLGFGHLPDRLGHRTVVVPALVLNAVALFWLTVLGEAWHLAVVGGIYGFAHGFYYPTLQAMVVECAGGSRTRAVASSTFAFGAGITTTAFLLGPVAKQWGYPSIYLLAGILTVVAAVALARERRI